MVNRKTALDNESTVTRARPKRTPVGARPRLHLEGKDPNFEYRWVNDTPGNIATYKNHGWQLCTNEEVNTGNFRAEQASEVGSLASDIVDGGTGMKAYVMKISKEEYQEIQDYYEDINRASEETMHPNRNDGEYGEIRIDRSGRRV
jgi:hypothetical protein